MQYHAISVTRHGGIVDLIGYHESPLHPHLHRHPRVNVFPLPPLPAPLKSKALPFFVSGPLKVLWQMVSIFYVLMYTAPPARWIIAQVSCYRPLTNTCNPLSWANGRR